MKTLKKIFFLLFQSIFKIKRKFLKPTLPENPKKILLIRNDHLGDFILSLSTIASIKKTFPDAKITLYINKSCKDLLCFFNLADDIIFFDAKHPIKSRIAAWFKILKTKYNLSIELCCGNTWKNAVLCFLALIPCRLGFEIKNYSFLFTHTIPVETLHCYEEDITFKIAKFLSKDAKKENFKPTFDLEENKKYQKILKSKGINESDFIIGMHISVATNNPKKAWDPNNFAELTNKIKQKFPLVKIVLIGTKDDYSLFEKFKENLAVDVVSFIGETSLKDTIYLMNFFKLFICNNSGPLQIATMLSLNCVVVNGPSSAVRWIPPNSKNHIVIKKELDCNKIDCQPKVCPKDYFCIKGISVEEVYEAVANYLS